MPARLTQREREVLRLLGRGHDAKSAAAALGVSVHSVNERLREARGKLGVTSSREAARLLLAEEGGAQEIGSKSFGVGDRPGGVLRPDAPVGKRRVLIPFLLGAALMSVLALIAFTLLPLRDDGAPRVVATVPAAGATVPPGPFALTVTFDRPMAPRSFSFVQARPGSYPDCARTPVQSADRRSFTLRCTARPGGRYEVWFNRGRFANFRSAEGVPAVPHPLRFSAR